jgi:hypothetical protein
MADADPLAAALAEARGDVKTALTVLYPLHPGTVATTDQVFAAGTLAGTADKLAGVVEAALSVHALTAFHRHAEPCGRHRYRGIADRPGCPDCKVTEWTGCETCRDEYGNPARPEDCTTRQAIARALAGEGRTGG